MLRPDPREVDRVFDVPLSELLADGVHHEELWEFAGRPRSIHVFELDQQTRVPEPGDAQAALG